MLRKYATQLSSAALLGILFVIAPCVALGDVDLRISSLTHSPDAPNLNTGTLTLSISAGNGSTPATGVTITDTLPAGVTYVSANPSQGSCAHAAGTVTCNIGSVSAFAGINVAIVTNPTTATPSAATSARISSNETDSNPGNNVAFDSVTILAPSADMRMNSLTHSPESPTIGAGQNITYTINVSNSGPSDATGVVVTDTLPSSMTFVSASPSFCVFQVATNTVTCNVGSLGRFGGASISIVATPSTPGIFTDTASVVANESDPITANNSLADQVNIVAANADLRINSVTHSPGSITLGAGQNLTFFSQIFNSGPSDSTAVTFTETLPPSFTFVSASPGACVYQITTATVTCNFSGIARSTSVSINVVVTPTSVGVFSTNVNVSGSETDPNTANNGGSDSLTVNAANADLQVLSLSRSADPPRVGQNFTYSVTAFNNGPSDATGVVMTDTLPSGVTFVLVTPGLPTCSPSGGMVVCNFGNLARSAAVNATITVNPTTAGLLVDTASVSGDQPDSNSGNNSKQDRTTATTGPPAPGDADIRTTITHSPDPFRQGSDQNIQYSITVNNSGPATATEVTLTDTLPAGVTFVAATVSPAIQGNCNQAAGTVTCALNTLTIFQSATVTIYVRPTSTGNISNSVSATATQNDPNPGNNTSVDTLAVLAPVADLRVTMAHSPEIFTIGASQFLQFNMTISNNGPSPATNVALSDVLPAGVTFSGYSLTPATLGSCNFDTTSNTLNCSISDFGPFASATVNLFTTPSGAGTVTNTASITSATPDPNTADNSATDSASVSTGGADMRISATHSPETITLGNGQFLQLFSSLNNFGPSPASSIVVTDALPPNVTFAGFSLAPPTLGNCGFDQPTNTVTCNFTTMLQFAGGSLTVFALPNAVGTISHTPTISATETDPNPANSLFRCFRT